MKLTHQQVEMLRKRLESEFSQYLKGPSAHEIEQQLSDLGNPRPTSDQEYYDQIRSGSLVLREKVTNYLCDFRSLLVRKENAKKADSIIQDYQKKLDLKSKIQNEIENTILTISLSSKIDIESLIKGLTEKVNKIASK